MSLPNAITRIDKYLNKIANPADDNELPNAITRKDHYLKAIAEKAASGGYGMVVTITKTGNTYTADKTYTEIKAAVDSGVSVVANIPAANALYPFSYVTSGIYIFKIDNYTGADTSNPGFKTLSNMHEQIVAISESGVDVQDIYFFISSGVALTNGAAISATAYLLMHNHFSSGFNVRVSTVVNDKKYFLFGDSCNADMTEFDFVNYGAGITAHIAANRVVTITTT